VNEDKLRYFLKRVTSELYETRRRLQEESSNEPVAVVAMGCRFPGGVRSPEDLWELVRSGTDAVSAFPVDRGWDAGPRYDSGWDRPTTRYARLGGFVYEAG
jgi:acyl transferase domain-containing protein